MFSKNSQLVRIHYYFFVSIHLSHSDRRIFLTFTKFIFLTPIFKSQKNFSPQYSLTLKLTNPKPAPRNLKQSRKNIAYFALYFAPQIQNNDTKNT